MIKLTNQKALVRALRAAGLHTAETLLPTSLNGGDLEAPENFKASNYLDTAFLRGESRYWSDVLKLLRHWEHQEKKKKAITRDKNKAMRDRDLDGQLEHAKAKAAAPRTGHSAPHWTQRCAPVHADTTFFWFLRRD